MNYNSRLAMVALFAFAAAPAHANPYPILMPDMVLVAGPAFILWFVVGLILILVKRKLKFIGIIPTIIAGLCIYFVLWDYLFTVWQVYLVLIIAALAVQKPGARDPDWMLNLVFHGGFVAAMMIGEVCVHLFYRHERWSSWRSAIAEEYAGNLVIFGVCAVGVFVYLALKKVYRQGNDAVQINAETSKNENRDEINSCVGD